MILLEIDSPLLMCTGDWTYNQNNELTGYDDVSYEYDLQWEHH